MYFDMCISRWNLNYAHHIEVDYLSIFHLIYCRENFALATTDYYLLHVLPIKMIEN